MLKLKTIHGYYEPFKLIKKSHPKENPVNEKELIEYLNKAYRQAIRKILLASPASFAEESPIFDFCIDVIFFNSNDITKVTVKWIEDQININKELDKLKNLTSDDPNVEKLRLIKTVTEVHQDNLAVNEKVVSFVNSALALEDILNKEYKYGVFAFSGAIDLEKKAVVALKEALKEKPVNLLSHLSTLRKSQVGDAIRDFVKQGLADKLLDGKTVRTVSDFITALHQQVNPELSLTASMS